MRFRLVSFALTLAAFLGSSDARGNAPLPSAALFPAGSRSFDDALASRDAATPQGRAHHRAHLLDCAEKGRP